VTGTHSIRFRLLVMILLTVLLLWSTVICFTWWRTTRDIHGVYDAELVQVAKLLAVATSHEAKERDLHDYNADLSHAGYHFPLLFQIWDDSGRLMVRGPDTPSHPLTESRVSGFTDVHFGSLGWRVYTMNLKQEHFRVQVARAHVAMERLVDDFVIDVIKPLLLALPLFGMLWYVVHRGLAPLRHVSNLIAERDYGHLSPVSMDDMPEESAQLVEEINALLIRLKESIERNSHFTADVAHELRTPIAGMLVQLQFEEDSITEEERHQVIEKVKAGLKRLNHVVNQLLTLSSIEPEKLRKSFQRLDLSETTREVIANLTPAAFDKGIELALEGDEEIETVGNRQLLGIMISNLLQNAINFTPRNGSVCVHVSRADDGVAMVVEDSGPGIPDDRKSWVFERLNRIPSGGGSGLGLSIVKEICKVHEASISLSDKTGASGLVVNLFLPRLSKA
jgi:two-component system, OmpR family, sensor histidine kinase QseC